MPIDEEPFPASAYAIAWILMTVVLLVVVGRLYYLQVIRGEDYLVRSESNFIQEVPIAHSRGLIFDRKGVPLVDNRPSHDVYVTYGMLPSARKNFHSIRRILELDRAQENVILEQIPAHIQSESKNLVVVAENVDASTCEDLDRSVLNKGIKGIFVEAGAEGCSVGLDPFRFASPWSVLEKLRQQLKLAPEELGPMMANVKKRLRQYGRFKPIPLVRDVDFETYARVESKIALGDLPGVNVFDSKKRRYIYGAFATHVLGFLNEISPSELKKYKDEGYRGGDRIGRRGLERIYETKLRGENGVERFVVDAKGRRSKGELKDVLLGEGQKVLARPGENLYLTLDYKLQKAAQKAFSGRSGSVIAMNVNSGEVLAMESFPNYDPNNIIARGNRQLLAKMSKNPDRPWVNKAIQEHYAPGSTFKPITAVAALEAGIIDLDAENRCTGAFRLGRTKWRCFRRDGHGHLNLADAIKTSCDSFFYELAVGIGPDKLAEIADFFGFGSKTGIDLDHEITGLLPDRAYYEKRFGYFAPGFVVNTSIGQGDLAVTPIQLAVAYAALVNGGKVLTPRLVKRIQTSEEVVVLETRPEIRRQIAEDLLPSLSYIRNAMGGVTQQGGTAFGLRWRDDLPDVTKWLRTSPVAIGGKTGTAQVVKLSKNIKHLKVEEVAYLERDHAWFVGFAPVENPEIVVVAMTEHGGFGGRTSAPVSARVLKAWFENKSEDVHASVQ